MFRRDLLRASATAGVVAVAGCSVRSDESAFEESFEDGLGDWDSGAAIGPEVELEEFDWEFGISGTEAASGDRSLRIWNEGEFEVRRSWGSLLAIVGLPVLVVLLLVGGLLYVRSRS